MRERPISRDEFVRFVFEEFYSELYTTSISLCNKSRLPVHFADDAVQNLFIKVIRKWEDFENINSKNGVRKYLFAALKNEVRQIQRSHIRAANRQNNYYEKKLRPVKLNIFSGSMEMAQSWLNHGSMRQLPLLSLRESTK